MGLEQEVFRMLECVRRPNTNADLLTSLLGGFERTSENVLKIRKFAHFNLPNPKIFEACDEFLREVNPKYTLPTYEVEPAKLTDRELKLLKELEEV